MASCLRRSLRCAPKCLFWCSNMIPFWCFNLHRFQVFQQRQNIWAFRSWRTSQWAAISCNSDPWTFNWSRWNWSRHRSSRASCERSRTKIHFCKVERLTEHVACTARCANGAMGAKSEEWFGSGRSCFYSRIASQCSTEWLFWQLLARPLICWTRIFLPSFHWPIFTQKNVHLRDDGWRRAGTPFWQSGRWSDFSTCSMCSNCNVLINWWRMGCQPRGMSCESSDSRRVFEKKKGDEDHDFFRFAATEEHWLAGLGRLECLRRCVECWAIRENG